MFKAESGIFGFVGGKIYGSDIFIGAVEHRREWIHNDPSG
jgi:hypothetical protein